MMDNGNKAENDVRSRFGKFWRRLVDLTEGLDREGAVFYIKNNRRMEGANAWMLMCSIIIASLGLDLNSPAVIIGAMLISPLMAPILGIGLSVATNDFNTLIQSLRHFSIAVGIAVVTSTIYFWVSPLGVPTPEILSRTSPTLFDVMVGFFGGLAGIISISRKEQSSAIPGVAIATALMPPLCVTGFGLANGNMNIAVKSFYLFFLNTFFVALATYFIVILLKFPVMRDLTDTYRNRKMWVMGLITFIIIVPSAWILYGVIQDVRLDERVDAFMRAQFPDELQTKVDDWDYLRTDSVNYLIVKVYGSGVTSDQEQYAENLEKYKLRNTRVNIIPTSEVDLGKVRQLEAQLTNFEYIADQLNQTRELRSEQDMIIDSLEQQIVNIRGDTISFLQVSGELKTLFPELRSAALAKAQFNTFETYRPDQYILFLEWSRQKSAAARRRDTEKIRQFVETRTGIEELRVVQPN